MGGPVAWRPTCQSDLGACFIDGPAIQRNGAGAAVATDGLPVDKYRLGQTLSGEMQGTDVGGRRHPFRLPSTCQSFQAHSWLAARVGAGDILVIGQPQSRLTLSTIIELYLGIGHATRRVEGGKPGDGTCGSRS